jgi:hypothetical protein
LPWKEALNFPGAWHYGFIHCLFEEMEIEQLIPANELVLNQTQEIRCAKSDGDSFFIPSNIKQIMADT